MLEQRGYQVHDVDADSRRGQPVLEVEAFKMAVSTTLFCRILIANYQRAHRLLIF